jgi:hypothetical protein
MLVWGALSDERTGLSVRIAAGPRQHSHSRVRIPWDLWPYFPVSSRVQSYITTDGPSSSLSWNKTPIWGLRPDFITVRQLRVCWCGELSLTRGRVCRLQLLLALASALILRSESHGTVTIFYCLRFETSFFVASYDPQVYGGGIRFPPPHGSSLEFKSKSKTKSHCDWRSVNQ